MKPTLPFPDIQDIVAPVEPAAAQAFPWGWWVATAVLTLALLGALWAGWLVWRKRALLPGLPGAPAKAALRALEDLRKRAGTLSPEAFATELSRIVRSFLQRQTGLLAHVSTSPEILGDRRGTRQPPPPPLVAAFREVLTESDAVKYGSPASPAPERLHALIDAAADAVRLASAPPPSVVSPPPADASPA